MATLSANGITLTYSTSLNENRVTITLSSLVKASNPTTFISRNVRLLVDGKTIFGKQATQAPSVTKILQGYQTSGSYTEAQRRQAEADRKQRQQQNGIDACTRFVSSFSSRTLTFDRSDVDKKVIISLYVLGKNSAVNVSVPRKTSSDGSTREESRTIGIENVNGGVNYVVNEQAYNTYGHIERVVDFSDVKDELQLLSLANAYVNAMQFDDMCLSVSAVDLHTLMGSVPGFELLDNVKCVSRPHGLDRTFPITEINIPLDDPSKVTYTFGKLGGSSMSQTMASNASDIFKRINKMPAATRILDAAKLEMSSILNARTTGYVNIVQENDISQALVISDTPDWTHADKLWKFDMNGLGFSDSTIGSSGAYDNAQTINADDRLYKIGITMDGTIVADFIKTGLLEDGLGYNYWNLATGEFQLSPNTLLSGDVLNGSVSNLEDLTDILEASYNKEVGTKNILRGSDDFSKTTGNWADNAWIFYKSNSSDKVTVVNSYQTGLNSVAPDPDLTKAVKLYSAQSNSTSWVHITQKNITLANNTVYTLGCYICGSGPIFLKVAQGSNASKVFNQTISHNDWRRYNLVFKTTTDSNINSKINQANTTYGLKKTARNQAYIAWQQELAKVNRDENVVKTLKIAYDNALKDEKEAKKNYDSLRICILLSSNNTLDASFGIQNTTKASRTVAFSGLTLVKGNVSSDWIPSESDGLNYLDKFDEALSRKKIVDKLTDGGKKEGIFLQNNHLYLNASYLMAGEISDKQGRNKWNLESGYLKTTSMVASNISATGTLDNYDIYGSYNKVSLWKRTRVSPKGLIFENQYAGPTNKKGKIDFNGKIRPGRAAGYMYIESPWCHFDVNELWISKKRHYKSMPKSTAGFYEGKTVSMWIKGMTKNKQNKIVYANLARMDFLHGLLVGVEIYDKNKNKLAPPCADRNRYDNGSYVYGDGVGYGRKNQLAYFKPQNTGYHSWND